MVFILLLTTIVTTGLISFDLLLKEPFIWPDEAIWADIAINLLREGRLGTNLLSGTFPGIENHALWYPSLFFHIISRWFQVFGVSIVNLRLLSGVFCFGFLIFFYLFTKSFLKKNTYLAVVATILLLLDFTFLRGTRISRPEVFILFFGIISFYFFSKSIPNNISLKRKYCLVLFSGIFAGLAFLNHFTGIFILFSQVLFFLLAEGWRVFRSKEIYLLGFAFSFPVLFWLFSIYPYLDILKEQLALVIGRKDGAETWLWVVFKERIWDLKFAYIGYILATILFFVKYFKSQSKQHLLILSILAGTWFFVLYGKQFWYGVFIIPFTYLAITVILDNLKTRKDLLKPSILLTLLTFFILLTSNIKLHLNILPSLSGENYSYTLFGDKILEIIPDGKTILLSSIPDPYFIFKEKGRKNILYEFPQLNPPKGKENYLNILNETDFIIYTDSYDKVVFGDLLVKYIEKNKEQTILVGEPLQFQALIVKLKPKEGRVNPD